MRLTQRYRGCGHDLVRGRRDRGCDHNERDRHLTLIEGYEAMRIFLETVSLRLSKTDEEIDFIVGSLKWADGAPADPTMWQDWLAAVQITCGRRAVRPNRRTDAIWCVTLRDRLSQKPGDGLFRTAGEAVFPSNPRW
jgi:hypothetical protein